MLYLFYNCDVRIVKILKSKISQYNIVMSSKKIDDIEKFKPDKVVCFGNEEVVNKCLSLEKKCINIT